MHCERASTRKKASIGSLLRHLDRKGKYRRLLHTLAAGPFSLSANCTQEVDAAESRLLRTQATSTPQDWAWVSEEHLNIAEQLTVSVVQQCMLLSKEKFKVKKDRALAASSFVSLAHSNNSTLCRSPHVVVREHLIVVKPLMC